MLGGSGATSIGRSNIGRSNTTGGRGPSNGAVQAGGVQKGDTTPAAIREDISEEDVFHSKGEANVARVLNHLGIKWNRGRSIDISKLAKKYGCKHIESGRPLKSMVPDFYLPDFDLYIEVKPSGLVGNDAMRIGLAYLKGERLEIWGKATMKLLEKAFKSKIGDHWEE